MSAVRNRKAGSDSPKLAGKLDASTVFALLAIAEIVADKLPFIPDRKSPPAFAWRILIGALSAAAATAVEGWLPIAIVVGAAGAVTGTLGGSALRSKLATLFDRDFPAALIEDGLVLVLALLAAKGLESRKPRSPALALPQGDPSPAAPLNRSLRYRSASEHEKGPLRARLTELRIGPCHARY
jgi:uncharacterized membrane protein